MVYVCILISQNTVFLTGRLTIGNDCLSCFAGPSQAYFKKKTQEPTLHQTCQYPLGHNIGNVGIEHLMYSYHA